MNFRVLIFAGLFLVLGAGAYAQTQENSEPAAETPPAVESAPELPAPEPTPALPPAPTTATVHVLVENVESNSGMVWLALCDAGLSVDGCPYKTSVPAAQGVVEATFENIPPGEYAVAGYHDVNDNGVFDMILKVPREPYALSGSAGEELVPRFKDAALLLKAGTNDVIIRMKRLGG